MKDRVGIRKKARAIFSAVVLLAATGIFAGSSVTAWAFPNDATVTENSVNVRQSAVDGEVVGSLDSGATVTVTDSTDGSDGQTWYQVEYTSSDGASVTGWMRGDFLVIAEDTVVEEASSEGAASSEEPEVDLSLVNFEVSSGIPSEVIPIGFQLTTVEYEGTEIAALVMNNADVYLLYMEDTAGIIDGRLVVYDMDKSELIPYITFETDNGFILLLNIPDEEAALLSDRFVSSSCDFTDGTMDAVQMTIADTAIDESIHLSDYYFMYGVNRDGEYGWYVYNATEGTIQETILNMHYNLNGTVVETEKETADSSNSGSLPVLILLLALLAVAVVFAVLFGVRSRRLTQEVKAAKKVEKKHSKADRQESKPESRKRSKDSAKGAEEEDLFADFDPVYYRPSSGTQSGQRSAKQPAKQPTRQSAPQTAKQPAQQSVKPSTQKSAKQPTQQSAPQTAKPSTQQSAPTSQPAKKTAQKPTRKPAEESDFDDDDLEFL